MALVAYGASDSEISSDEDEPQTPAVPPSVRVESNPPKGKLSSFLPKPKIVSSESVIDDDEEEVITASKPQSASAAPARTKVSLFASLPKPTRTVELNGPVEASDEVIEDFVKKKEEPIEQPPPKPVLLPGVTRTASGKVKITVPSLKDLGPVDCEDEEEKPPTAPQFKKSEKKSGLFAVLPPPKTGAPIIATKKGSTLVPLSVSRPKPPPAPLRPPAKRPAPVSKAEESDDEEEGSDFFGFNAKDPVPIVPIVPTEILDAPPSPPKVEETHSVADGMDHAAAMEAMASTSNAPATDLLEDQDALLKLQGKRGRVRENMDIIELNAESHMPAVEDWMTKQLSQEQPTASASSKKAGKMPGRHRHQITYLAQLAKERELELKNQWAQNRFSRRQTQNKYGF